MVFELNNSGATGYIILQLIVEGMICQGEFRKGLVKFWLGNSGNSVISVKDKDLTNLKMYVEGIYFFKGQKNNYKATKYQVSVVQ